MHLTAVCASAFFILMCACCCVLSLPPDAVSDADVDPAVYTVEGTLSGQTGDFFSIMILDEDGSKIGDPDTCKIGAGSEVQFKLTVKIPEGSDLFHVVIYKTNNGTSGLPYFKTVTLEDSKEIKLNSPEVPDNIQWKEPVFTKKYKINVSWDDTSTNNSNIISVSGTKIGATEQQPTRDQISYVLDKETHLAKIVNIGHTSNGTTKKGPQFNAYGMSEAEFKSVISFDNQYYYVSSIGNASGKTLYSNNSAVQNFTLIFNTPIKIEGDAFSDTNFIKTAGTPFSAAKIQFNDAVYGIPEEAFKGSNIGQIEFKSVVGDVGAKAFYQTKSRNISIDMPYGGSIGDEAFAGCTKLSESTLSAPEGYAISLGENIFNGSAAMRAEQDDYASVPLDKLTLRNVGLTDDSTFGQGTLNSKEIIIEYTGNGVESGKRLQTNNGGLSYSCNGTTYIEKEQKPTFGEQEAMVDGIRYKLASGMIKGVPVYRAQVVSIGQITDQRNSITIPQQVEVSGVNYMVTEIGTGSKGACVVEGITFDRESKTYSTPVAFTLEIKGDVTVNAWAFTRYEEIQTAAGQDEFYSQAGLTELTVTGISSIGTYAFYGANISSLDLSETLTIGDHAFFESEIQSLDLSSVQTIGEYAFCKSSVSGSLVIPDGCTVGTEAFGTTGITYLKIGSDVKLGRNVFSGCNKLISYESSLAEIPKFTFYGCKSLRSVQNVDGLTIGESAFQNSGIESLDLSKVKSVGDSAFANTPLTEIVIPVALELSGGSQFSGCASLTKVTLEGQSIPDKCFSKCTALTEFVISSKSVRIGQEAFKGTSLAEFEFSGVTEVGTSAFEATELKTVTLPSSLSFPSGSSSQFKNCSSLVSASVGASDISANCFEGCTSLSTVSMSGVSSIGDSAFKGCSGLGSIDLSTITKIGKYAFVGTSLTSLTLTKTLTEIGMWAFEGLGITELTIPDNITSIGSGAFKDCSSLKKVIFSGTRETIPGTILAGCTELSEVVFPDGLKTIGGSAFEGCTKLDISETPLELTVEDVLGWGWAAFKDSGSTVKQYCTTYEGATGNSDSYYEYLVLTLKSGASSTKVMFLINVVGATLIQDKANYRQELPANLVGIYSKVLSDDGITAVVVDKGNEKYASEDGFLFQKSGSGRILIRAPIYTEYYEIPSDVIEIGDSVFKGCSLQEISIPEIVKKIGSSAFNMNKELRIVQLNEGLVEIGEFAFDTCDISTISIPSSVEIIGKSAFTNNKNLVSVTISTDSSLKAIGGGAFYSTSIKEIFLPVLTTKSESPVFPSSLSTVYLASGFNPAGWKIFSDKSDVGFYIPAGADRSKYDFDQLGGCETGTFKDYYVVSDGSFVPCNKIIHVGENTLYFITLVGDLTIMDQSISGQAVEFGISAKGGYSYHDLTLTSGADTLSHKNGRYSVVVDSDTFVTVSERSVSEYYELSFDSAGGSSARTISIGAGRTLLDGQYPVPTKNSMEFAGWFITDSVEFTEDTPVNESMRLVAHWTQSTPMVRFHADLGTVAASIDQGAISDGTRVAKGSSVSFSYTASDSSEFIQWQISSAGKEWTSTDSVLVLEGVNDDLTVTVKERYHSNSSGLTPIITTDTPTTDEQLSILWNTSFKVDTSMAQWTGHSSVPLIVDDHVFVRASDRLYMIEVDTGFVTKSVSSESVKQYYHYLGYAHGLIVDYAMGKVYDSELNEYDGVTLNSVSSVFSDETATYVYGDGILTKYDPSLKTKEWSRNLTHKIYGQYGTTSSVVMHGGYLYYIYAGSGADERGICAIDASSGNESAYLKLDKISGFYLDDGWMTCYDDTLYMTCYTVGLFGSKVGSGTEGYVVAVPIDGSGFGTPTFTASASQANSEFVVYNGRGYVNAGYSLLVYSVDKTNLTRLYSVSTAYSHGGIVVDTAYATEENGQEVLIYLIPYNPGSGLYVISDRQGQTSGTAIRMSTYTPQYNSQAVRSTSDGKLVWYTDSGNIYSEGSSRMNDYYFFIEGPAKTAWYHATGATAADALASLGSDVVTLDGSKQLSTVGGSSAAGWKIWALSSAEQATNPSDYSWKELSNLYDAVNDTIHYYVVSKAAPTDGAKYSYIDGSSVKTYEFSKNIGDRDIVGQTLIAGEGKIVSLKFYDGDAEIDGSELIGKEGGTVEGSFPSIYKSGWSGYWVDESDEKVTTLPDKFPSESKTYSIVWVQNSYAMKISYSEVSSASYFSLETERTTGDKDVLQGRILLIATYDGGEFVNVYSDELAFDADGKAEAKVMGVSTKDLVIVHAYLVSGTPKGAFESYGECAYTVDAG